jgi:hypothetical protein
MIDSKDLQKSLKSNGVVMKIGGGESKFVCSAVYMAEVITSLSAS